MEAMENALPGFEENSVVSKVLWCARDLSKMWVLYVFGRGFVGLRANENLGRNERRIVSNPWL